MIRIPTLPGLVAVAALSLPASVGIAAAQGVFVGPPPLVMDAPALDGKRARVARELTYLGFGGADVARLSNRTVALLDNAIHADGSQSYRQSRVRSILSGGGILQRAIDRIGGRD